MQGRIKNCISYIYNNVLSLFYSANNDNTEAPRTQTKSLMSTPQTVISFPPQEYKTYPKPADYGQSALINKINLYLNIKKRNTTLKVGYCHGLTLLWLYKMLENQEAWFYNLIKTIVNCKPSKLLEIEIDIEKFLSHIEWAQNSNTYSNSNIKQIDTDKILEVFRLYRDSKAREYSEAQLKNIFNTYLAKENVMTVIHSKHTSKQHAIGIFRRGNYYFLFNANHASGEAIQFRLEEFTKLYKEIKFSLYDSFRIPQPNNKLTLTLVISRLSPHNSQRLLAKQHSEPDNIPLQNIRRVAR